MLVGRYGVLLSRTNFQICRKEGSARNDKLLIVYKEARSDETDPRVAFTAETITDRLVLPLLVVSWLKRFIAAIAGNERFWFDVININEFLSEIIAL